MVRLSNELGSEASQPGPDHQDLNEVEEVPHSDTAPIDPAISNQDDRSAVEGATEAVESVGTRSLVDVVLDDHGHPLVTASSSTAAVVGFPQLGESRSSVRDNFCSVHLQRYMNEVRRLHPYMPHLINVRKRSRAHHRAELRCLDFSVGHLLSSKSCKLEQDTTRSEEIHGDASTNLETIASEADPRVSPSEEDFIRSFIGNIPSEVDRRVLIVEDLSDTLMYILGSCLHVTPEVFEEHLVKSGWHDNNYEDREPDMWSTRNLTKNYASIRWYRPIKGLLSRPCEEQASEILLTPQTTPDSWEENSSPQRRILHHTEPMVNLLRRPWEVRTTGAAFSAWEERATVWETTVDNCSI
ncbi:MAG: hypothetical protein Q9180_008459, partial [Flavoplaca navasiana]